MTIISFRITGDFAAFKDPSITSNQVVYYIPSKSAVVGILGAMIGIHRSDKLGEMYCEEYIDLFKNVKIGLQLESKPKKTTFFTNHRSLKEAKTKPFKTELVVSPTYLIYVNTNEEIHKRITKAITENKFAYMPYLGHAYCPARIYDFKQYDVKEVKNVKDRITKCVVLDESNMNEQYPPDQSEFKPGKIAEVIIERHIHHFFKEGKFDARILKYWIPVKGTEMEIRQKKENTLSKFYEIEGNVICMY